MASSDYTYLLRLLRCDPDALSMERLGQYLVEWAKLIGEENHPVFKGIKRASVGLKAFVSLDRQPFALHRLKEAVTHPDSRPARHLRSIETMLGHDHVAEAQILDSQGTQIAALHGAVESERRSIIKVTQSAVVDGVVVGLVSSDESMLLHIRRDDGRVVKLTVRDVRLAQHVLAHFRAAPLRFHVRGAWCRDDSGWMPDTSCVLERFEELDSASLSEIVADAAAVEGNGWKELADPIDFWKDLRGIA